jgi:hypothetical protein
MFYPYGGFCGPKWHKRGFFRGYGYGPYFADKDHLEFAKKELENRLDYVNKELAVHPNDPELTFERREIENRIDYINKLLSKV